MTFKIIFNILIIFFTLLILDSFYKIFFKVKFLSKKNNNDNSLFVIYFYITYTK